MRFPLLVLVGFLALSHSSAREAASGPAVCRGIVTPGASSRTFPAPLKNAVTRTLAAYDAEGQALFAAYQQGRVADIPAKVERLQGQIGSYLRKVIGAYGWPNEARAGTELSRLAWRLTGSLQDADLMDCAAALARPTLHGDADRHEYARLVDQLALRRTGKQEFGTVYSTSGFRVRPLPLRDPGKVDERRAALGLPPLAKDTARVQAELPVTKLPGLPKPVAVPKACREYTTARALNAKLNFQTLAAMEDRVAALVDQGQAARRGEVGARDMAAVDGESTAYVESVLKLHGWPSANRVGTFLAQNMWLLAQHADATPDLQTCVLKLIERQGSTRDERRNLAYLTDRVRLAHGEMQVYGTQVTVDDVQGKASPRPLVDPGNVDKRRASVGLEPLAAYLKRFLSPLH